jgi:hypothetical protein
MEKKSRISFNPVTKEIEVEGSERFVKAYFNKLQAMISGPAKKPVTAKKKPKAIKAAPAKKAEKKVKVAKTSPVKKTKKKPTAAKPRPVKKVSKAAKRKPGGKKITNMASVVELIQASKEGISTSALKEKTGLSERQIWSIVNHASKEGKILKAKRGLYSAAASVEASPEKKTE